MNEAIEKACRELGEKTAQSAGLSGMLGGRALMEPARPSLREAVASQLHRANTEKARAERLAELDYLLEKNPEVARILDLMDEVRR